MFVNTYDIELETPNGETVTASLRLMINGQIKLKKKFNENTVTTLFTSIDDPEKLSAVFDEALNWDGNKNTIKRGAELLDLMAMNGLLGMLAKQRIITKLAQVSGILSEDEKEALDAQSDTYVKDLITGAPEKNS